MGKVIALTRALIIATVIAYLCASALSTSMVIADLAAIGAPFSLSKLMSSIVSDWVTTYAYLIVILIGYLIAFPIAKLVKSVLTALAAFAYPIAGGAALVTALALMAFILDVVPIGGARSTLGMFLQFIAGGIGGLVFELGRPKH